MVFFIFVGGTISSYQVAGADLLIFYALARVESVTTWSPQRIIVEPEPVYFVIYIQTPSILRKIENYVTMDVT